MTFGVLHQFAKKPIVSMLKASKSNGLLTHFWV